MRVYLDICAFNRPFDDQSHIRIRLEAEAKLFIQSRVKEGDVELVWSYILDIENDQNPFKEKRIAIDRWRKFSVVDVAESRDILGKANQFVLAGVKPKDALHVACAIAGGANYFVTTDDKLLKKMLNEPQVSAIGPIDLAALIDERNN
jgi:predicted nucleic acid-binding protein